LPITLSIIKTILHQLQVASKYYEQINNFILKNNLGNLSADGHDEELIIYSYWSDAKALAAAWLRLKWNTPAISRAHGWDVYFERHTNNFLPFRKYLHDHLSAVYFVSENGRNYSLQKIPGTTNNKFRVAYLGTILQGINPDDVQSELVIVSCASLIPLKRIHLIAEILEQVKNIPIRWIHFGDGEMKNALLMQMKNVIGMNNLIQFDFRGEVDNETLLNFYKTNHVDLFILTSEYEGLPLAIMEALSFGIPVVATNAGGISEIINSANGLLLEKKFMPEAAAQFISSYYSFAAEKKQNYRDAAVATWKNKLNAEKNYPEFINAIKSLV
jgi:glycosyltransferase involved in cell wall biosynthesis